MLNEDSYVEVAENQTQFDFKSSSRALLNIFRLHVNCQKINSIYFKADQKLFDMFYYIVLDSELLNGSKEEIKEKIF